MLRALKLLLAYVAMAVTSLIVAAAIWSFVAPKRFYHCWDDAPVATFLPPFVHPGGAVNERQHDYFILPRGTVYSVWFAFLGAAVIAPAVVLAISVRLRWFYERHNLFRKRQTRLV